MSTTFYQHRCNIHGVSLRPSSTYKCHLLRCDTKCITKITFDAVDDTWRDDCGELFEDDALKEPFTRGQYRERMKDMSIERLKGHMHTIEQNIRDGRVGPIFVSELKRRHKELTIDD
jgi:hypothetical protein